MGSAANATRTPIRTPLVGSAGRKAPLNAWRTAQITRRGTLRQSRLSARAPLVPPVSMRSAQMPPQGTLLSQGSSREAIICAIVRRLSRRERARRGMAQPSLRPTLESLPRKMARPHANITLSGRLNGDHNLSVPPRDDRPIDMAGGLAVSNGLKAVDIAPPGVVDGTSPEWRSGEGTSAPSPGQVDSLKMKTVFLGPGLKSEFIPVRGVPKRNARHQRTEEQADHLSLHLLASLYTVVGFYGHLPRVRPRHVVGRRISGVDRVPGEQTVACKPSNRRRFWGGCP